MEDTKPLHRKDLASKATIAALGLVAVRELQLSGSVAFYIDSNGYVLSAPTYELTLDGLPEEMAIAELLARGYQDNQLEDYLKGRDARLRHG
jgi:hypothetical protein